MPGRRATYSSSPSTTASHTSTRTKNAAAYSRNGSRAGERIASAAPGGYCQVTSSRGYVPVSRVSYQPR